jgi:hypothetical protein
MITLDYQLDSIEAARIREDDLLAATDPDLDYYLFCGDIFFRVDDVEFDAAWGWVPVINFSYSLCDIIFKIKPGEERQLEFTESESLIGFVRRLARIEISASYATGRAEVDIAELKQAAGRFAIAVFNDLSKRWPTLLQNEAFNKRSEDLHATLGL